MSACSVTLGSLATLGFACIFACSSTADETQDDLVGSAAGTASVGVAGSASSAGGAAAAGATSGGGAAGVSEAQPNANAGSGDNSSAGASAGGSAGQAQAGAGAGAASDAGSGGAPSTAELPIGVPQAYTLQLDEPFATEVSLTNILAANPEGWTFNAEDGGSLEFTGAGYAPMYESLTSFAIVAPKKFGSFVLEVELMQTNPTAMPHRDLCIVFSAVAKEQYYYAHIAQEHADMRSHEFSIMNDAARVLLTDTNNGGITWTGGWQKFRLVHDVVSGDMTLYMDDDLANPVLTANDPTLTGGYIGFGTFMDSGRVRNLKVWAESSTAEPAPASFFE